MDTELIPCIDEHSILYFFLSTQKQLLFSLQEIRYQAKFILNHLKPYIFWKWANVLQDRSIHSLMDPSWLSAINPQIYPIASGQLSKWPFPGCHNVLLPHLSSILFSTILWWEIYKITDLHALTYERTHESVLNSVTTMNNQENSKLLVMENTISLHISSKTSLSLIRSPKQLFKKSLFVKNWM